MAVFRIEKTKDFTIMSNHHLKNTALSLKAKGLQSLILSLPESWNYTTKGLACICKDGLDSISAALNELEKHGYLTRRRLRDGQGRMGDTEYTIHEHPVLPEAAAQSESPMPNNIAAARDAVAGQNASSRQDTSAGHDTPATRQTPEMPKTPENKGFPPIRDFPILEKPILATPILGNPAQASPVLGKPEQEKTDQLSIKESNTHFESKTQESSTHPIHPHSASGSYDSVHPQSQSKTCPQGASHPHPQTTQPLMDTMDRLRAYRCLLMDNIEYDVLCEKYRTERVDELLELLLDTLGSNRPHIRIAGEDFPAGAVKSRLLKLDQFSAEYVFDCLDKNTTKIHNIKAYLLTALYNAPATIGSYYRAEVNHDLYGG